MPHLPLHILAADAIEIIIGVVIFALWILGQLASVLGNKKKKQQQERANPVPTYEETIAAPVPNAGQQRRRRQPAVQQPAARPKHAPSITAEEIQSDKANRQRPGVSARQVQNMLKPGTIKQAFVITEILNKPKGLQE